MSLERIPVVVEAGGAGLTGNAPAVLQEVAALLRRLVEADAGGAIDLTSLPFSPADRAWLEARLGRGEVEIRLEAGGLSTFSETGLPGVWWVRHHNDQGALVSELLEVGRVPEIVAAHPEDVERGLERLHDLIHGLE